MVAFAGPRLLVQQLCVYTTSNLSHLRRSDVVGVVSLVGVPDLLVQFTWCKGLMTNI